MERPSNAGYSGTVKDMSVTGLGLTSLPTDLAQGKQYTVMVIDKTKSICCEVKVSPCWTAGSGSKDAGFLVERSARWVDFVTKVNAHNQRTKERKRLCGYIVDIKDAYSVYGGIYGGIITNVSLNGLQIDDLPSGFLVKERVYNIRISDKNDATCFTLKASPCWQKDKDFFADAGFKLVEADAGWEEFVQKINGVEYEKRQLERKRPDECLYVLYGS